MPSPYPDQPLWPAAWGAMRVIGTYIGTDGNLITVPDEDGNPGPATVTLTPNVTAAYYMVATVEGTKRVAVPRSMSFALSVTGKLDALIPAGDAPNVEPSGWTWRVVENWPGGETWNFVAVNGAVADVVDLRALRVSSAPGGLAVVRTSFRGYDGGFL